jgi:integrase
VIAKVEGQIPDFRPHDLRRTAATGMGRLGVPRFIIDRVLAHVDRSVGGIYDRWHYLEEKRDALERWSRELQRIVAAHARLRLVNPR